jgi:hypothetical protein
MRPRTFVLAAALALPLLAVRPGAPLDGPAEAEAAISIHVTLEELVRASTYVVVGTADERHSAWEDLPGGRRIVTYTRVKIDRPVVGAPGGEVWVRTLGGAVGKIGQLVSGEAQLALGQPSLLFLTKDDGVVVVTAMAQGHYRIVKDGGGVARLAASPDTGTLLPRPGPTIPAREPDDAAQVVTRVRRAQDEKK